MVEKINEDFMQLVSKNRKIEKEVIKNDIGGLIFNSSQAKDNFLIDEEIGLEELVNLIIQENEFKNLRVLKKSQNKDSLFNMLFSNTIMTKTTANLSKTFPKSYPNPTKSKEIIGPAILTIPTFFPEVSMEELMDNAPNLKVNIKIKKEPSPHHNHLKFVFGLIFIS